AEKHFRKAIELYSAIALRDQQNLPKAGYYANAAALKREHARAYYDFGICLHNQQKLAEVEPAYRKAIELNPLYAEAHYMIGNLLFEKNTLPEAVQAFKQAIELQPKWAEPLFNLGRAYVGLGQFADGLVFLRQGHELGSQKPGWSD